MSPHKKIEYVIFDMDGKILVALTALLRSLGDDIRTGLMIDSERVYTEVTSN